MKKILLVLVVAASNMMIAQKMKVNSAKIALSNGDVAGAIKYIEEALTNPESAATAAAWVVKGDVYRNVYETNLLMSSYPNALFLSKDAYIKANDVEPANKKKEDIKLGLTNIQNYLSNEGITRLQSNKIEEAYPYTLAAVQVDDYLNKSGLETTLDTNTVFAYTLAGDALGKKQEIIPYLKTLINAKHDNPFALDTYIKYKLDANDTQDIEMYFDLARTNFPEEKSILYSEINYYLAKGQSDLVINKLNDGIKLDPNNSTLYFSRGSTYESLGKLDLAILDYAKAEQIDPSYFNAIYSQGALYFNQAVEINKKMSDENDMKKYNAMKVERDALYNKALPHLEKAYNLDKADSNTVMALKEIYAVMNMMDKYEKVKNGQ